MGHDHFQMFLRVFNNFNQPRLIYQNPKEDVYLTWSNFFLLSFAYDLRYVWFPELWTEWNAFHFIPPHFGVWCRINKQECHFIPYLFHSIHSFSKLRNKHSIAFPCPFHYTSHFISETKHTISSLLAEYNLDNQRAK